MKNTSRSLFGDQVLWRERVGDDIRTRSEAFPYRWILGPTLCYSHLRQPALVWSKNKGNPIVGEVTKSPVRVDRPAHGMPAKASWHNLQKQNIQLWEP